MSKKEIVLKSILVLVLVGAGMYGLSKIKTEKNVGNQETQIVTEGENIAQASEFDGWLKMLRSHAHPKAGENWEVTFLTKGKGDLEIIPEDKNTIDDADFVSLSCGEEKVEPQILENDVIFVPDWQCDEKLAALTHKVNKENKHTLRFNFQAYYAFAYNSPDSITDSFTDTSKVVITASRGVKADTAQGEVSLAYSPPKRVFVTNQSWTGNLGGLGGADKKCQDAAVNAGLGSEWVAWLSISSAHAKNRVTYWPGGYTLINGTWIANNWEDLIDGGLLNPLNLTETGITKASNVWTGTNQYGEYFFATCDSWNSTASVTAVGRSTLADAQWTVYSTAGGCSNSYPLYCFEK